ncbi:MAG: gliding motility-associated C-terminal domain-containing protein [Bacteroidetes bacterium]|nr:gliding motility-associated C-terminal domain-containing protein [Bacteroidota bacterium]
MKNRVVAISVGLILLFFSVTVHAQLSKHGNIWYFGFRAGLDFSTNPPTTLTNVNMDSYEGCAVYCDDIGKILLYTNGGGSPPNPINGLRDGIIWNKNQQVMYNMGADQGGGYSAAQSALILPKPGVPNRYFVFTMDHAANLGSSNRGLSYFEVDMTANGGLGAVVNSNVLVYKPATEALTAVPMANGAGFWLLIVDGLSGDFVVTSLTSAGIGPSVVHDRKNNTFVNVIKASPDGQFLCVNGEVYQFDAVTGTPSFKANVSIAQYTLSFSPSSRYLYGFESDASPNILRYDLGVDSVSKSGQIIPSVFDATFAGLMQLAPDGNIYFVEQRPEDFLSLFPTISLSRILCPDGLQPTVDRSIFKYDTDLGNAGGLFTSLPNFADYIFARSPAHDTIQLGLCAGDSLSIGPDGLTANFLWSTGAKSQKITVKQSGIYTVSYQDVCGFRRTEYVVNSNDLQSVSLQTDSIKNPCQPFPLTLRAQAPAGSNYLWSSGSTAAAIELDAFGTYTAKVSTSCGDTTLSYSILKPVVIDSIIHIQSLLLCDEKPLTLIPDSLGMVFTWSNGANTPQITAISPGNYTVTVENNCIQHTIRFEVSAGSVPKLQILGGQSSDSCLLLPITLRVSNSDPDARPFWSVGVQSDSLRVSAYGTYIVAASNACGVGKDTLVLEDKGTDCCHTVFPNAFTPNGDTRNDTFGPVVKGCKLDFMELNVYSRWGQLVFQGFYPNEFWDGKTLTGSEAPSDVYYYQVNYRVTGAELQHHAGQITLIR